MATAAEQMYMKWSRKKLRITKKKRNANSSRSTFNTATFTPPKKPAPRFRQTEKNTRAISSNKTFKSDNCDGKVERMIRSAEVSVFDCTLHFEYGFDFFYIWGKNLVLRIFSCSNIWKHMHRPFWNPVLWSKNPRLRTLLVLQWLLFLDLPPPDLALLSSGKRVPTMMY